MAEKPSLLCILLRISLIWLKSFLIKTKLIIAMGMVPPVSSHDRMRVRTLSICSNPGGYSRKFYMGRQTSYPFIIKIIPFFDRKRISFIYLRLTNGTPFTYLLTAAVNVLSFKI